MKVIIDTVSIFTFIKLKYRSEHQAMVVRMKSQIEALQCKLSAKEEVLKMKEDAWKTKEEAWKYLEATLKSNNIKTEMQAPLPPLVSDAIVQTDSVLRMAQACQTQQLTRIDCGVQANLHPESTALFK